MKRKSIYIDDTKWAFIDKIAYDVSIKGPDFEELCKRVYNGHPIEAKIVRLCGNRAGLKIIPATI